MWSFTNQPWVHFQIDLLNPGHETCVHQTYDLTCRQYERLLARANGLCQMCEVPAISTPWRKLHIDHDHEAGWWAVRGLLCGRCNMHMDRPQHAANKARYLTKPWYHELLEWHGIGLGPWPEPPLGAYVTNARGGHMVRKEQGWIDVRPLFPRMVCPPWTWNTLMSWYGPHRIKPIDF